MSEHREADAGAAAVSQPEVESDGRVELLEDVHLIATSWRNRNVLGLLLSQPAMRWPSHTHTVTGYRVGIADHR